MFDELAKDRKLWRFVDARNAPHGAEKFAYCCERMHEETTHFLYRGEFKLVDVLADHFLTKVPVLKNLKVLALENQYIFGDTVSIY